MSKLTVICGPPCAGKSTYLREHGAPGDLRFDWDELYQTLTGLAPHERKVNIRSLLERFRGDVAAHWDAELREGEENTWIITSGAWAATRQRFRDMGAEVVLLQEEQDECHRRATADGRPDEWHDAIRRWFTEYQPDEGEEVRTMMKPASTNGIERRVYDGVELRVDAGGDDGPAKISGYAAVFNKLSERLMGGFREHIRPGAFAKSIQEGDVRALWNHNPEFVLGRTKSGTLALREDDNGLFFEATPPDTQWARDFMVSVERRDVDQASFGFRAIRDEWSNAKDDYRQTIRELIEVKLSDVSPITFPAYLQTDIQFRSIMEQAGIDWDAITAVLTRSEHELELREADHETVKTAIDTLSEILTAAPGQEPHPAGADGDEHGQARVRMLRRRLDLAAVS